MKQFDRALGMDASISQRDFLGSTLIGAGGALLAGASGPLAFSAYEFQRPRPAGVTAGQSLL
ncbi:hypothetical protein R0135_10655 [Congregibacter variabilis]|uniref:Twin-arginine translocation signal domain-containing protein n=1 Tax=Congregibacter variabilis TaxID=3081200 RepID=A0ABZ0HYC9_9GAMM|nr:hypothetical protein R0135_10655 [Congregibacter sp. IMCC43200]